MSFLITLETETISTFTINICINTKWVSFNKFITIFVRTPFDTSILIRKISTMPVEILLFVICLSINYSIKISYKVRVRNNNITSSLWTRSKHTGRSITSNLFLKILSPTHCTKLVSTYQLISFHFFIIIIKLHVHDIAHVLIVFF